MKKRLVITGAGGFLGRHIIKEALKHDTIKEIVAITIGSEELKKIYFREERIAVFEAGALSRAEIKLETTDIVINCAYPRAMKGKDVTLGLDYIEYVFQESAKARVAGIINISSQSIYDPQRTKPAIEKDIPVLTDEYAIGKYCNEILLRNICKDIPYTNIRLASLIGPGFDVRVPNKMVKCALETKTITVADNEQRFGYLDVEDAAFGLVSLFLMQPRKWKHVYNMGGVGSYSLLEIANVIKKVIENEEEKENKITITLKKSEKSTNSEINSELLKADIGNYCMNDINKTIKKIVCHERDISKKGN